jgi:hypothetical protein
LVDWEVLGGALSTVAEKEQGVGSLACSYYYREAIDILIC